MTILRASVAAFMAALALGCSGVVVDPPCALPLCSHYCGEGGQGPPACCCLMRDGGAP
jgi:hypothetical protein